MLNNKCDGNDRRRKTASTHHIGAVNAASRDSRETARQTGTDTTTKVKLPTAPFRT